MDTSFKNWLQRRLSEDTVSTSTSTVAGVKQINNNAIKNIGDKVGQAMKQGKDAASAAADASTDAAKTIAANAANAGGKGAEDLGTAVNAAASIQNNISQNQNKLNPQMKMKKK